MSEYIERGALIDWLTHPTGFKTNCEDCTETDCLDCIVAEAIKNAPAADVVEVKHGRWEDRPTGAYGRYQSWCTACGKHSGIGGIESNRHKPYCPNCGAKMRGDG